MVHTNHPFRASVLGIVAMLNVALLAPVDVRAQEEEFAAAPAIAASWDETSGYGAMEATRAAINALPEETGAFPITVSSDVRWAPARAAAPMPTLGANRDATAVYEALAYGPSRDESLPAVDANSAATAVYEAMSYGPTREAAVSVSSVEASRVIAAQRALASGDLGGMQEEALMAVVAAGTTWDEMSGYGSVEATRAAISSGVEASSAGNDASIADEADLLATFRAVELSMSSSLGTESNAAPLARGTRAESAVLWTILLEVDTVQVNCEDGLVRPCRK